MTEYYSFQLFLVLGAWSIVVIIFDLFKRNYETIGPIVLLCSVIGLSCNYAEWLRVFSIIYKIEWWG